MLSLDQIPSQVEQMTDSSMSCHKPLGLPRRFESPHSALPDSGRLMRLLYPTILILLGTVNRFRDHLSMSDTIASQLFRHDLPGISTMIS